MDSMRALPSPSGTVFFLKTIDNKMLDFGGKQRRKGEQRRGRGAENASKWTTYFANWRRQIQLCQTEAIFYEASIDERESLRIEERWRRNSEERNPLKTVFPQCHGTDCGAVRGRTAVAVRHSISTREKYPLHCSSSASASSSESSPA